eukprot:g7857.t1
MNWRCREYFSVPLGGTGRSMPSSSPSLLKQPLVMPSISTAFGTVGESFSVVKQCLLSQHPAFRFRIFLDGFTAIPELNGVYVQGDPKVIIGDRPVYWKDNHFFLYHNAQLRRYHLSPRRDGDGTDLFGHAYQFQQRGVAVSTDTPTVWREARPDGSWKTILVKTRIDSGDGRWAPVEPPPELLHQFAESVAAARARQQEQELLAQQQAEQKRLLEAERDKEREAARQKTFAEWRDHGPPPVNGLKPKIEEGKVRKETLKRKKTSAESTSGENWIKNRSIPPYLFIPPYLSS